MMKQIRYFQAVVRCKSFTEAAEECYISQSAISQQIQALERDLGVQLIKREGRKFSLTEAGTYFYQKSLILLNDFDCIVARMHEIAGGAKRTLTVAYWRITADRSLHRPFPVFVHSMERSSFIWQRAVTNSFIKCCVPAGWMW